MAIFQVSVFHPYFIYIDQYLEIMPQVCNLSLLRKFLDRSANIFELLPFLFSLFLVSFPQLYPMFFQSIQSVLVTSAFMMVVSFILIPNPVCSLWVAFSIMSIEVGGLIMMMIYMLMMMTMMTMMIMISVLSNLSTTRYPTAH